MFHKASRNKDGLYHTCKTCRKTIDKEYYKKTDKKEKRLEKVRKLRRIVSRYKSLKKCKFCNESEACCLDLHHNEDKKFNVSQAFHSKSWDSVKKEVKKCTVLCSNCHRKLHFGFFEGQIENE